ncbi:MAG: hypothetical protein KGZ88_16150 [Methylomicrobium sp.]|nr:hypothetical protein [Methylomicrobium sp.]
MNKTIVRAKKSETDISVTGPVKIQVKISRHEVFHFFLPELPYSGI